MKSLELRQQRAALVKQAREIIDKADAEKRELTAEERQTWDRIMGEVDTLKEKVDREERTSTLEREMATSAGTIAANREQPANAEGERRDAPRIATPEYRDAFLTLVRDPARLTGEQRAMLEAERRAQSAITGTAGGYVVPQGFRAQIVDAQKWFGGIRQSSVTVLTTNEGNDLPIPSANDTAQMGELVAENTPATSQDVTFGQVVLKAYKYSSKTILVPIELLQDSGIDLEAFLARKLGERVGRIQNLHFTTGDNAGKPQGIVTGATLGKTGAAGQTTSVTPDDLVDLIHAVDPAYRQGGRCQFMFHDTTLKALKKLKDSQNRPLWLPGLAVREPDTINGYPFVINNDMPEMAVSAKSILFGDLSTYHVRDVMAMQLFRIVDKYIEAGQVGFLIWARSDGRCVDAGTHPIAYYQNAAA